MTDTPTPRELRAWAGHKAPTRGQLPNALVEAWNRAHPDRLYPVRRGMTTWVGKARDVAAVRDRP
jgi:hypothetical protein